jgi:hypothetical protein
MDVLNTILGLLIALGVFLLLGIFLWGATYSPKKT